MAGKRFLVKRMSAVPVAAADDLPSNKFVWRVDNLERLKYPTNGDTVDSKEFTIYGVRWRLKMYPKGYSGIVMLFLECIDLNGFQKFECDFTLSINELNLSDTMSTEFTEPATMTTQFHSSIDFLNLETITIECNIVPKRIENLLQDLLDVVAAREVSNKFVWEVKEMEDFADAAVGDRFASDEFMMYGVKWSLLIFPKGVQDEDKGNISLHLLCHDLNGIKEFECDIVLTINEFNVTKKGSNKYTKPDGWGWDNFHSNVDFLNLKTITVECKIVPKRIENLFQDLRDVAEARRVSNKFVWKVDDVGKLNNALVGDKFESDEFVVFGVKWSLRIHPKGRIGSQGYISLLLTCVDLGPLSKIDIDHTMTITELNESRSGSTFYDEPKTKGLFKFCSNECLSGLETLTIESTIVLKDIYKVLQDLIETATIQKQKLMAAAASPSVGPDDSSSNKFVWSVTELEKIKNAAVGGILSSDQFTMYGVKWRLDIYPKGDRAENEGMISLFLRCLDLNGFQNFVCDYTLSVNELKLSNTETTEFTKSAPLRGWTKFHSNVDLLNLETITIECTILPKRIEKLLQDLRGIAEARYADLLSKCSDKYIWKVDCHDLDKFRFHQYSDEFVMFGAKFKLEIPPQQRWFAEEKRKFNVDLYCIDLQGLQTFEYSFTMKIEDLNVTESGSGIFVETQGTQWGWDRLCTVNRRAEFRDLKTMTVEFQIMPKRIGRLQKMIENQQKRLVDAKEYIPIIAVSPSKKIRLKGDLTSGDLPIQKDDADLYKKHATIMSEWNQDTARLKELQSNKDTFPDTFTDDFFECRNIVKRQMERLNAVERDEYLGELMEQKCVISVTTYMLYGVNLNVLSTLSRFQFRQKSAKLIDVKCGADEKEWEVQDEEYKTLKTQRQELQNKIKSLVTECNVLVRRENAAAKIRDQCTEKLNEKRKEREIISASSSQCAVVTNSYKWFYGK